MGPRWPLDRPDAAPLAWLVSFFKGLLLGLVRFGMFWTWDVRALPQSAQILPPSLCSHLAFYFAVHPLRDFRPAPQPAISGGLLQHLGQFALLLH